MKIDPYKHEERWFNWKAKVSNGIPDIGKANSKLILKYLNDMVVRRVLKKQGIKLTKENIKREKDKNRDTISCSIFFRRLS